ncbi:hypothetical protein [Pseudomonas gingeri]|uniref:hypothetical protein n=1 Tax=Pseudomonas gingeri TaxID=117681 RepID=UPI0015A0F028|nr:hypothetical protein [Pseudomonas gingeri]NWA11636.1 hypothetical protein [Pseudomonas gingeri]
MDEYKEYTVSFTPDQIEQAKSISDLMGALGKALENSPNAKAKLLGEALSHSGDISSVLSDMAKLEATSDDFLKMLDSAAEVAAGMLGGAGGIAALDSFIIGSVTRALAVGALASTFPIMGTLALGAAFLGAAYVGGTLLEGAYGWAKDAAQTLSSQLPSGVIELPETFVAGQYPDALVLDPTYVNGVYDGYPLEADTQQFLNNYERGLERGFLEQMQKEINEFNFSLSSLVKPGNGFLYRDGNGMLGWDGGYGALQDYAFNSGGLDLSGASWQSAFNEKMTRLIDSANSMEAFINSNFGRANEALGGQASAISNKAVEAAQTADEAFAELTPLAFDLSGNGIETRSIFDGIKGFEFIPGEKGAYHGWLDRNSGFLALDRNGNGIIDDGSELFGGPMEDGFTALRRLDSNGDGRIDAADALYDKLLVWQDKNQNTVSDADELMSLQEAGIKSISLDKVESVYRPDKSGNTIKWISEYTLESGETQEIADVYFRYSKPASAVSEKPTTSTVDPALEQQTQLLVNSMAAFNPPASGDMLQPAHTTDLLNVPLAVN